MKTYKVDWTQNLVPPFCPNNITLSITRDTRFVHEATHATLRRSGSMTAAQKEKRDMLAPLFTFEQDAIKRSFTDILDHLVLQRPPVAGHPLVIITDEKLEYVHS